MPPPPPPPVNVFTAASLSMIHWFTLLFVIFFLLKSVTEAEAKEQSEERRYTKRMKDESEGASYTFLYFLCGLSCHLISLFLETLFPSSSLSLTFRSKRYTMITQ